MKIVILHHDIEPPELKFKDLFLNEGATVDLRDIREVSIEELLDYDVVFNRVYSSVASRDFDALVKTLTLLKGLQERGVKCVNSYESMMLDYSKYELFKALSKIGIKTPPTILINSTRSIKKIALKAIEEFGFPLVVKRNCGGKSYEVTRAHTEEELITTLKEMFKKGKLERYRGGFLLQKFIKPLRDHDCRVGVVNGEFIFSYARTLKPRNSEDNWMASTSNGSVEFLYSPTEEEKNIAITANNLLGVSFSESDVSLTSEGPYIIEINLSPSYFLDSLDDVERMRIIVKEIVGAPAPINKEAIPLQK